MSSYFTLQRPRSIPAKKSSRPVDEGTDDYPFEIELLRMPGAFPASKTSVTRLANKFLRFSNTPPRLPVEVLGNIFTHCLNSQFTVPCTSSAPLLLCRINRSWRQVALSTPSLWASLRLQLPPRTDTECMVIGVQAWLDRSGALPLSIRIDSHPTFRIADDFFFNIFLRSFPRWCHLTLHIPTTSLVNMLKHPEAWAQLTRFTLLSDASVNHCLEILRLCPRLKEAHFPRIFEYCDFVVHPDNPIILPSLHTLQLFTKHDIYPLLDSLELPVLSTLTVLFYWTQGWQKRRLLSLVERSSCPIERLILEGQAVPESDLIDCVERMPELRELYVSCGGVNSVTSRVDDALARRVSRAHM